MKRKPRYEVQTWTLIDGWVNCWHDEDDKPWTFKTRAAAKAELRLFLDDVVDAVRRGDMTDEYDPSEYRVRKVK